MKNLLTCLTFVLSFASAANADQGFLCQNKVDSSDQMAFVIDGDGQSLRAMRVDDLLDLRAEMADFEIQYQRNTYSCLSMNNAPLVQQADWKVTSKDGNTYYDPPILQRKSPGKIEQRYASRLAIHMPKSCKMISREGNVIYDPPMIRCRHGGQVSYHHAGAIIPRGPF